MWRGVPETGFVATPGEFLYLDFRGACDTRFHGVNDAGVLVGTFDGIRDGQADLGYWIRTDATGQGLGTTAARLCARFAFEHSGLRRVHRHHHVDTHGSRRVAEKTGFVREGLHRQVAMLHDTPFDAVFYSLLGPDEVT